MPSTSQALLEPRKSPVQARSAASVDAILDATIQVLLRVGMDRLTTTRVAARAGVSVGTLYQYYPNKQALLQAVSKRHMEGIAEVIERICREQKGNSLQQMGATLVTAFLEAKMRDVKTSVALYSTGSEVEKTKLLQQMLMRLHQAVTEMLASAREPLAKDPKLVASMLQAAMSGVVRKLLESPHRRKNSRRSTRKLCSWYARTWRPAPPTRDDDDYWRRKMSSVARSTTMVTSAASSEGRDFCSCRFALPALNHFGSR